MVALLVFQLDGFLPELGQFFEDAGAGLELVLRLNERGEGVEMEMVVLSHFDELADMRSEEHSVELL
jgi:hypothetical protein